ncbi:lectin BRA-3-like [Penaeus monodon]|uniref:lectin BRA-3-like n=1 Tax=Penaeus monodon TaxID=6687 RepID=UPI0018A7D725|nr:lectin BRA-3-like [Penaeus monodon]
MKCWHHEVISNIVAASSACLPPFMDTGVGCFYQHTQLMSWCDARIYCSDLGGDLAVPQDYYGFEIWIRNTGTTEEKWIGAKALSWINGVAVTSDLWAPSDPNGGPDECIRMVFVTSQFQLADTGCDRLKEFVCEVKF